MALTQVDQGLLGTYAQYTGFKNRIINGAMAIDQRNAGASVTPATGAYTLDRWNYQASQASKFTVQQTPSATETGYATRVAAGFTNYLACTVASSVSVGASDYFFIDQRIEGFNTADLAWGTSSAKTVTLSFLVYSSLTGTFGGSIQNSANTRAYPFTYSVASANTWTSVSVTIAGDTSGTWIGATNGVGLIVNFGLGVGSTYSGTAGAWATGNYYSATGATSVVGTGSATFYITGVQLEKGSTATSFDYRPYGTELALCQRYYQTIAANGASNVPVGMFAGYSSAQTYGVIPLKVQMRSAPTFTSSGTINLFTNGLVTAASSLSISVSGVDNAEIVAGGSYTSGAAYFARLQSTTSYLGFSAEL